MNKFVPFMLIFVFISGLCITTFNPASAAGLVQDSWNAKTSMDIKNVSFSNGLDTAVVDGKIYAMGGSQFGSGGINACYDPVTDKWTILKTHPNQSARVNIFVFQDKIYCIDSIVPSRVIEVYDIATDSWGNELSIPELYGFILKAHVIGEKVFIITTPHMLLQNPYTDTWYNRCIIHLYVYDLINERCVETVTIPFPQHHTESCVSVVVDDKILLFGSFFTGTSLTVENKQEENKIFVYDIETNVWSEVKSNVPDGLSLIAGVTTGLYAPQKIYFFKSVQKTDSSYDSQLACTYVYDPFDNSWSTVEPMPTSTIGSYGVAVVDDVFYVIGEERHWYNSGSYNKVDLNLQYVPLGYHDALPPVTSPTATPTQSNSHTTSEPEQSNPTTSEHAPSKPHSSYLIVATLAITIVTVTGGLFFYFKKRNRKGGAM
jgi:hypothetical protein